MKKSISIIMAVFVASMLSFSAQATENPFGMSDRAEKSHTAMSVVPEGKCGGDDKKCGGDKKKAESKCGGEKKCGSN